MYILYFLPYFVKSTYLQMVFNINVYFLSTYCYQVALRPLL